jgi:hypothetical protein
MPLATEGEVLFHTISQSFLGRDGWCCRTTLATDASSVRRQAVEHREAYARGVLVVQVAPQSGQKECARTHYRSCRNRNIRTHSM